MKVLVLKADGTVEETELNFAGCQKAVGGFVALLKLAKGVWAYVNDDGISLGLPANELATAFCRRLGPNIAVDDYIKGDMVVAGMRGIHNVPARAITLARELGGKAAV